MFEAIERGEIKALVGDGDQSGRVAAARRRDARCAEQARALRCFGERRVERHGEQRCSHSSSRRRVGREGRHGHEFRAPHLAPARVPAAPRRGEARLVDRQRKSRRRMGFDRCVRLSNSPPTFSANTPRCRRSRTTARAISTSARSRDIGDESFDALDPVVWPCREGEDATNTRFFADGGFFTPDRKARFIAPEIPALREARSNEFPFVLNTGRVRDQWHTMTRTGLEPAACDSIAPEPFVEIHPEDARALGLKDFARVTTAHGDGDFQGRARAKASSAARCSCRSTGAARPHRRRASASWSRRTPIPTPASPRRRRRRAAIAPVEYRLSRLRADARGRLTLPEETWWARVALDRRHRLSARVQRRSRSSGASTRAH